MPLLALIFEKADLSRFFAVSGGVPATDAVTARHIL